MSHLLCHGVHRCPLFLGILIPERLQSLGRPYLTPATHWGSTRGKGGHPWRRTSARCPLRTSSLVEVAAWCDPDESLLGRTGETASPPAAAVAAAAADGAAPLQLSKSPAGAWTSAQTLQLRRTAKVMSQEQANGAHGEYRVVGPTLTVSAHALGQALLQTAVLAAVAAGPVDLTVALSGAGVGHGGQLAPSEKSLRTFESAYLSCKCPL